MCIWRIVDVKILKLYIEMRFTWRIRVFFDPITALRYQIVASEGPLEVAVFPLDKVFVSVYAITETNTNPANFRTCCGGSSHCFENNGTLLCGRGMKCHINLHTRCSPGTMAAGAMFEFNYHFKHSTAQSSFIHIIWIILPMAVP